MTDDEKIALVVLDPEAEPFNAKRLIVMDKLPGPYELPRRLGRGDAFASPPGMLPAETAASLKRRGVDIFELRIVSED